MGRLLIVKALCRNRQISNISISNMWNSEGECIKKAQMPLTAGPLGVLIGPEVAPLLSHLKIKSFVTFPFQS